MRTIQITQKEAYALGDDIRFCIIQLLKNRENTVDFIFNKLLGQKSKSTIRHHVKVLLDCGLLKQTKMIPRHGSFVKYYKSTVQIEGFVL